MLIGCHLSLLLVLLGTCLPARAQSSSSEGCLNLKRLGKKMSNDTDESTLNKNHPQSFDPYLPLHKSQRANEQCGAIFCIMLMASKLTTS